MPGTRSRSAIVLAICAVSVSTGLAQSVARRPIADVTPIVDTDAVHRADKTFRAALKVRLPEGFHVNSHQPRDPALIPLTISVDLPPDLSLVGVAFPMPSDLQQQGADQLLSVFEREFVVGLQFRLPDALSQDLPRVPVHLRYQACDETRCYFPATAVTEWVVAIGATASPLPAEDRDIFEGLVFDTTPTALQRVQAVSAPLATAAEPVRPLTSDPLVLLDRFTIAGSEGGYLRAADFVAFIRRAEAGAPSTGLFDNRAPLTILLLVLVGGLALNLTPCVLPMVPINLAIIGAGAHAGSRRRGLLLGGTYGAAMALAYGALGLVVILTAGTFGSINASPWFNAAIAVVFVGLALAMFDRVFIDFSRFSTHIGMATGRGPIALAFSMGAVSALLAGACVAPVVIQVLVLSSNLYASGTSAALALPFVLGVGMAIPWPLAGAGLAALPRPGAWMVRVKQVLGVGILATALYYGYTAFTLFSDRWVDPAEVSASAAAKLTDGWHASLAEGLAIASRDHKPVLVDLWATWCKNCLVMDNTTLRDAAVTAALDGYVKVKFQAEDPDHEPIREVMQRLGAVGLPTYVVLLPKPETERP